MYHRGVVVLGVRINMSMMAKQTNSDRRQQGARQSLSGGNGMGVQQSKGGAGAHGRHGRAEGARDRAPLDPEHGCGRGTEVEARRGRRLRPPWGGEGRSGRRRPWHEAGEAELLLGEVRRGEPRGRGRDADLGGGSPSPTMVAALERLARGRRSTEALQKRRQGTSTAAIGRERSFSLLGGTGGHERVRARGQREMAALRGSERERSRGGRVASERRVRALRV